MAFRSSMGEQLVIDDEFIHDNIINQGYDPQSIQRVTTTTHQHPTIVHEQLENLRVLRDIEMQLRGVAVDFETGKIIKVGEPIIKNKEFLSRLLTFIRPNLDKNTKISDLADEEIYVHMLDLYVELALFVYLDGVHYYQLNPADCPIIMRIIINPIFSNYKSSRNGRQLDALREIEKVTQNQNFGGEKRGLLSKLGLKL